MTTFQTPARFRAVCSRAARFRTVRFRATRLRAARFRAVRALLAGAALACFGTLASPAPAAVAHPFGPPSTARISADGSRVSIAWRANADDWVALGQSLGAFEDPESGTVSTELTGEQKLQRSPAVHTYLLRHITVAQDGSACKGEVAALERLLDEGARLTFDCPAPLVEADVTVSVLTDLNEAYRTMLMADGTATPRQTLFTAVDRTHHLRFTASGGGVPGSVAVVAGGTAVAVLAVVAGLFVRRSRRRTAIAPATGTGAGGLS
ncbi:hypothetical protein [Streptomyces sp. NPDC056244]|uniref:hypothetical protein n=1 Tax=Streptomyces sp. NPDC056244 TaxID=3345762 RepID=UPI0035DECA84